MSKPIGWILIAVSWFGMIIVPIIRGSVPDLIATMGDALNGEVASTLTTDLLYFIGILALAGWSCFTHIALKSITGAGHLYMLWGTLLLIALVMPVGPLMLLYVIGFMPLARHLAHAQRLHGHQAQPWWLHLVALIFFPIGIVLVQRHIDRIGSTAPFTGPSLDTEPS